ncbi:D-hexose-6-phosphate mutarotase [Alteromonadaceae bacterium M269]|nr:D-hexose-6-phosphate mutarotase [Alteromonadaceae bacterium M269]
MSDKPSISLSMNEHGIEFVNVDNQHATAKISLFGGHLLSFIPKSDQHERLWLSPNAKMDGTKAIRGGIPICWPWFGDYKTSPHYRDSEDISAFPAHGFLRTQTWDLISTHDNNQHTMLRLKPQTSSGAGFDKDVQVELIVEVGKTLTISLVTTNLSSDAIAITAALHTYFSVADIEETKLNGLSGIYVDKTRSFKHLQTPSVYEFSEETDRAHLCQPEMVTIASNQETNVYSEGHDSIVVWNPWKEKSISMSDMTDDGYKSMLCVETAVTQLPGQKIQPGQSHCLKQVIS